MQKQDRKIESLKTFDVLRLLDLAQIAPTISKDSGHFCMFLAVDGTPYSDEQLHRIARIFLDAGLVYLCAWGPGCERVHDCFDHERSLEESADTCIMTTWHSKDSLAEALWFFVYCTTAAPAFESKTHRWIAVTPAQAIWAHELETELKRLVAEAGYPTPLVRG